jgi:hypothetical protein
VFLVNSRYPRFAATRARSACKTLYALRPTLSRSYGGNMQSSFTRVLSSALVFSTHPPVSVSGTDTSKAPLAAFLGSGGSTSSPVAEAVGSHHISGIAQSPFDRMTDPYVLEPSIPALGSSTLLRPR